MGTSGAYTGAGGRAGAEVSDGLSDWANTLPGSAGSGDGSDSAPSSDLTDTDETPVTEFPPKLVSGLMRLLTPRSTGGGSSDGPGTGGGGTLTGGRRTTGASGRGRAGSSRSLQRLASVGGRAAAGAYAFAAGDAAELRSLDLDYGELRALDDPFEVARRIVDAVCGQQATGTLEESEERYVAATVAVWVLEQGEDGNLPDTEDVARFAIASVVTEVLSSELGEALRDHADEAHRVPEKELRDAAWVLAEKAELSTSGPTAGELTRAIEEGIQKLRAIYGDES